MAFRVLHGTLGWGNEVPLEDNSSAFQSDIGQRGNMTMTPAHQLCPGVWEGWATLLIRFASVPPSLPAADAH